MEAVMSKIQSTTIKLSNAQLVILGAAAQRGDRSLLPFPQSHTAKGAAISKVVETLCNRKLVEERRTTDGAPEWRRDKDGRPLGLFITTSGLLALGVDDTEKSLPSQAAASLPRQRKTEAARPRSKARKAPPPWTAEQYRLWLIRKWARIDGSQRKAPAGNAGAEIKQGS
jgi:hypothetical protein